MTEENVKGRDVTIRFDATRCILPNGPLLMTGNLEVVSGTGRTTDKVTKTALCRCGQSRNKPYCDGSHAAAGFVAD